MNLAPHGLLLQVIVWLVNFQHGFRLCGGTEPGYLDFDNLPETNFSCQGKVIGGYYADVETGCQMFHVCTIGQKDEIMDIKFLCLNGTVFDQETRVCERVDEVDCSKSERFYNLNLELYGNNAVTLSLHEETEEDDEPTESIDEQQYSTSTRPTVSSTTTTTPRPTNPPPPTVTTSSYHQPGNSYSGYQSSQPSYSTPRTSQSKSLYDDKNSGYHRQYIFHNGEQANNQATSFQLFSNQGISSTTNVSPQVHQVLQSRYSSTPSTQIRQDSPSTVTSLFHGPSSTIQTLLNSNSNNPTLINPLFHNHGVASTTEHYTVHSNNPRETQEYHHSTGEDTEERRPLEAMQSTNKGKVSKLVISPVPSESSVLSGDEAESRQRQSTATTQQSRIPSGFVAPQTTQSTQTTTTTTTRTETTAKTFYPTPRTSPKPESEIVHVVRHVHLPPPPPIPQLKPEQITINLPPPDILSIVQNPSPLLPSQSRVIVTAKATVSDESGRPLNSSEIVTIPLLPTVPVSYDDYKEGDESFDPFYRDVPKIRNRRELGSKAKKTFLVDEVGAADSTRRSRRKRSTSKEDDEEYEDDEEPVYEANEEEEAEEDELSDDPEQIKDIEDIRANLKKFKAMLLGYNASEENKDEGIVKLADEKPANDAVAETEAPQTERSVEDSQIPDHDEPSVLDESAVAKSSKSESELSADTRKPDVEEYIEFKSVMNTKGLSDAMEYFHDTKDAETGEQIDSEIGKSVDEGETRSVEKMNGESVSDAVDSSDGEKNSHAMNDETSDLKEKNVEVDSLEDNVAATTVRAEINSTEGTLLSNVTGSTENKSSETRTPEVGESVREDLATQETSSNTQGSAELESTSGTIEPDGKDFSESNDAVDTLDSGKATEDILNGTSVPQKGEVQPDEQDSRIKFEIPETERTSGPELDQTLETNATEEVPESEIRRELAEEMREDKDDVEAIDEASGNIDKDEEKVDSASVEVTTIEREAEVSSNEENKSSSISLASEEEEQIDSQIFEEPESRSSKEVDTRAIASHGSKSPEASSKNSMITKKEVEVETTSEVREDDDESYSNDGTREEDEEYTDNDDVSNESDYFSSLTSDEYPEEISSESPNRIPSGERDADATIPDDEIPRNSQVGSVSTEYSASSSREPSNSQTSSDENLSSSSSPDYAESDYTSGDSRTNENESLRSMEDYGTAEDTSSYSQDYSTISSNESNMDYSSSAKASSYEDDIDGTGVLKFTDEIPIGKKKQRKGAIQNLETNESQSSTSDYVDDNYEPDHYAEKDQRNSSTSSEETTRIHANSSTEVNDETLRVELSKNQTNGSTEKQETMEFGKLEGSPDEATEAPTSEAPSFTEIPDEAVETPVSTESDPVEEVATETVDPTTTTTSTTTTTTTTSTTTTTTTTTTPKPTPPSLFRPFSMRKNFNYIPPTTTSNPVVIKHRFGLTNPKPAKPMKSYNEIAAKPVIRPHPLLTRKGYDPKSTSEKTKEPQPNAENSTRLVDPPTTRDSLDEESTTHTTLATSDVEVLSRNDALDSSTAALSTSTLLSVTPYPLLKATMIIGNNNLIPPPNDELVDQSQTTTTTTTTSSNVIPLVEDKLVENDETTTVDLETTTPPGIASHEKPMERPHRDKLASFNCLDKDPYRFYADPRDCRLFHYCSPGFTIRQMLDFRFVCENTTVFDEKTQTCRSDLDETKCSNLKW